jgi:integrase
MDRKGKVIGYQAKLRRVGFAPQPASRVFNTEKEAKKWAGFMETRMDNGEFRITDAVPAKLHRLTVVDALDRYELDLKVRNGDAANVSRVRQHLPTTILNQAVADLIVDDLKAWRDNLVNTLAPATVNRTLTPLRAALNLAADSDQGRTILSRAAWEIGLKSLADAEEARNVVLSDGVIAALVGAAYGESQGFGLFVEVAAVTGSRCSQIAGLTVGDLQTGDQPRLMMPSSKKGKGVKAVKRQPLPIPKTLGDKLAMVAKGRRESDVLVLRGTGEPYTDSNHHVRPWARVRKAAQLSAEVIAPYTLEEVTIYALRHSSIVRQILHGVPLRVIAALHDTSVAMIERNYSRYIANQADGIARAALPAFTIVVPSAPSTMARPTMEGSCRHGHSYRDFPPYVNAKGSVVCAECARQRVAKYRAKESG